MEKNIQALAALLVRRPEGWLGFPSDVYTPVDGWAPLVVDPSSPFSLWSAVVGMPALRYYRLTGYEPALKLASDLMTSALQDSDGGKKLFKVGHFHCQSRFVTSLLMRGILKNDKADVELAESLYRTSPHARARSRAGSPNRSTSRTDNRSNLSETCCLTDMLEIAILLAKHRNPVYWHDAERYVRNHLLVHQIVDTGWVAQMTPVPFERHPLRAFCDGHDNTGGVVRGDEAMQSLVGGFAGWGAVTAMSDDTPMSNYEPALLQRRRRPRALRCLALRRNGQRLRFRRESARPSQPRRRGDRGGRGDSPPPAASSPKERTNWAACKSR